MKTRSRVFVFAAIAVLLAGCVAETGTPQIRPAKGASAEQAFESFAILFVAAELIGESCGAFGIRRNYVSKQQLITVYVAALERDGYSGPEMLRVIDRMSKEAVAIKAVARLKAGGVRDNDRASLCKYGLKEISSGTALGKLLRT